MRKSRDDECMMLLYS